MTDFASRFKQTLTAIETAKQRLAQSALKNDSEGLAIMVNGVAFLEGRARVENLAADCQAGGRSKEDTLMAVYDLLVSTSNDTYSGRGNDARRAKADGMKDAARDLQYVL